MSDLVEQSFVFTPASFGERAGCSIEGPADALASYVNIRDHKGRLKGRKVIRGTGNGDRPISVENAMAVADIAGTDARELQRNNVFVQQAQQPAERAHEALRLIGAAVHGLGPSEGSYFLTQLLV